MAVYQGARLPGVAIGARGVPGARPQVSPRDSSIALETSVARPRMGPAAVLLVILAAAMLAFAYLTQTLDSSATSVEIRQLQAQAAELQRRIKSQQALVLSEASAGNIRDRALALGLSQRKIITVRAP